MTTLTAATIGRAHQIQRVGTRIAKGIAVLFVPLAALLGCWYLFLAVIDTSPLIAKSPTDVWHDLTAGPDAAASRQALVDALWTTLWHAGLGMLTGLACACVFAVATTLSSIAGHVIRPIAIALTCIPTVAFAPIIILMLGNELAVVAAIGGLITMVPCLYYLMQALSEVSPEMVDSIRAGGGRKRHILLYAQLPTAVPALALSLRIAAPGAFIGALLAEWLATGNGLGLLMISSQSTFDYGTVWAATFLVTVVAMIAYGLAVIVEHRLLRRWAPHHDGMDIL
ncbi:ABC transporter permease [Nocardia sp. NPDC058658]|uniref:ABC transporter permease n=1 Tax=Nocardia sp. NPDC058658 TaxID=3346580 RepID=UPI00364EADD7